MSAFKHPEFMKIALTIFAMFVVAFDLLNETSVNSDVITYAVITPIVLSWTGIDMQRRHIKYKKEKEKQNNE